MKNGRPRKNNLTVNIAYFFTLASMGITGIVLGNAPTKYEMKDEIIDLDLGDQLDLSYSNSDVEMLFAEDNVDKQVEYLDMPYFDDTYIEPVEVLDNSDSLVELLDNTSYKQIEDLEEINDVETLDTKTKPENIETLTDEIIKQMDSVQSISGMKISPDYEEYLRELCDSYAHEYSIPSSDLFNILLTIGYRESAGEWNNNGVKSSTDDLGEFQINVCHLEDAEKAFGYTYDDLLNDKYKNADYTLYFLCSQVINNSHCKTMEDVFGMYNGWVNWKDKPQARAYSEGCMEILTDYFGINQHRSIK